MLTLYELVNGDSSFAAAVVAPKTKTVSAHEAGFSALDRHGSAAGSNLLQEGARGT